MRIKVVSRRYFKEKKGTAELADILASYRVVSIQSTYGMDSEPPFEKEMLAHPNLLAMVFDDDWDRSCEGCDYIRLFRREDAERIVQFVGFGRMPLIVQCTAGISRCGAVVSGLPAGSADMPIAAVHRGLSRAMSPGSGRLSRRRRNRRPDDAKANYSCPAWTAGGE